MRRYSQLQKPKVALYLKYQRTRLDPRGYERYVEVFIEDDLGVNNQCWVEGIFGALPAAQVHLERPQIQTQLDYRAEELERSKSRSRADGNY